VDEFTDLNPGAYLRLTVRDTGHGIDPEVIDKIFEPYFTTKGIGEGTGMGLALVHGIVRSQGGDINVESAPGKGSSFTVFFPKYEKDIVNGKEEPGLLPSGTERILFVDDEEAMVDVVKVMLERLGYHVTTRTSSIDALEDIRSKPDAFDLVITDMTMPNMTGKDLAKELMTIRPDFPIILCTGFSEKIDERRAQEMGINAFVMKPIFMRDIANTIRAVLDKK
jgi:CheY-like chemotaxis protein